MFRVFYAVWGERYYSEAARSAESLLSFHPNARITVLSPEPKLMTPFTDTITVPKSDKWFRQKSIALSGIAMENFADDDWCLYLDSDTYILGDLSQVKHLVAGGAQYGLALSHAPNRKTGKRIYSENFIDAERDFNSGVIFFNPGVAKRLMFNFWHDRMSTFPYNNDQIALSEMIRGNPNFSKVHVLTDEWNFRTAWPGVVDGQVRIIHGRGEPFEAAIGKINKVLERRVWLPGSSYEDCWIKYGEN